MAGLVGGAVAFTVASSRGLDSITGGEVIGGAGILIVLCLAVLAVARVVMFQDLRFVAVTLALVLGAVAGDAVAFRVLPGTTTDGELALGLGSFDSSSSTPFQEMQKATCAWGEDRTSVLTVTARRPVGSLTVTVVLPAGSPDGDATATVEVIAPPRGAPILRYAGEAQTQLSEPSGRAGTVTAEYRSGTILDAPDVPTLLRDQVLAGFPAHALLSMQWDCPQLP